MDQPANPPVLHVVLYQPCVPPNTGNIGRLCVGMNCMLHLIGPHAIDLSSKAVRRAGLDYWQYLTWREHATAEMFLTWLDDREPWLITKFAEQRYFEANYQTGDVLIFGNEVTGLPQDWHERWPNRRLSIPIRGPVRSFNQANSVAMVVSRAIEHVECR